MKSNIYISAGTTLPGMKALITKEEDMFISSCPETGTTSQGKTVEEALDNLKEATQVYLEEFPAKARKLTLMTTFEVAESA